MLWRLVSAVLFLVCSISFLNAETRTSSSQRFSADQYDDFVIEAVRLLAQGKEKAVRAILSPSMLDRSLRQLGQERVDFMIQEKFIGFFDDFHHLSNTSHSMKTTDGNGNVGLAIFRSFFTATGEEKPFALYVVEEKGQLVVGNLLVNKTLRDVSELKDTP